MKRRLERTRQMLLTATADTTVTGVAIAVGFLELGRFAQRYRQRFGESPAGSLLPGSIMGALAEGC